MEKIEVYDTTLRDGRQGAGVNFSIVDLISITHKLDELGVDYIEAGWPGSNPKDIEFFDKLKNEEFKNAKIVAFGSTRLARNKVQEDPIILSMLNADTPVVTIFGKTWDLHVKDVLGVDLETNLKMIRESVSYLKEKGKYLIYDAEHFFDGYNDNPEYAIKTLQAAVDGGADNLSLCETNGGMIPFGIEDIVKKVKAEIKTPLGIHAHNDSECGVANSLAAVRGGAVLVQGTINGFGERTGNANLCSILPNLKFKMGYNVLVNENCMKDLTEVSRFVSELANLPHDEKLPYVGNNAFAHKAGIHVNAVRKNSKTYEHIDPGLVGNHRRILISDYSGKSSVIEKAKEFGIDIKDANIPKKVIDIVKEMESEGFQFEGAEASFELLLKQAMGEYTPGFSLKGFRIMTTKVEEEISINEATIKVVVGNEEEMAVAEGDGPVNALDKALRKVLEKFYPVLKKMHLIDYKVRILAGSDGTAAKTRVLIESKMDDHAWGTVGVSENIIEASWQALVDSIEYLLLKYNS